MVLRQIKGRARGLTKSSVGFGFGCWAARGWVDVSGVGFVCVSYDISRRTMSAEAEGELIW